jgi:hypothetical protein
VSADLAGTALTEGGALSIWKNPILEVDRAHRDEHFATLPVRNKLIIR